MRECESESEKVCVREETVLSVWFLARVNLADYVRIYVFTYFVFAIDTYDI